MTTKTMAPIAFFESIYPHSSLNLFNFHSELFLFLVLFNLVDMRLYDDNRFLQCAISGNFANIHMQKFPDLALVQNQTPRLF